MKLRKWYDEKALGSLAKDFRLKSGLTKSEVARALKASRPSVQQAEENPEESLTKLRIRMIEACSPYEVVGPLYILRPK